ncbi:uncharacterized protein LOC132176679 [Corylus avellana]|uniref:uncharacterized protein LOC132176679 n=1 Tax=Corylus avellana TaxID=13451 RepID=UPI002869F3DB|nr:uncharacterized protein LOC132176679 [Corylus avellana]
MAAKHLAKKALYRMPTHHHHHPPAAFWRAPFSTAAQDTNAVAEGRNLTSSVLPETTKSARSYEAKDQAGDINDDDDDTARQGAIKAMETAEAVGETVLEAMDSACAYDVTAKTTQEEDVRDTTVVEADNHVVDTAEYRSIQDAAIAKQTETS